MNWIIKAWRRIRRPRRMTVNDRPSPELQQLYQDLLKDMERQVGIPDAMMEELKRMRYK